MLKRVLIFLGVLVALVLIIPVYFIATTPNLEITSFKMMFKAIAGTGIDSPAPEILDERLKLPEGFHLSRYATEIPGARMMALTKAGDILVSVPRKGKVMLVGHDTDGDGKADAKRVLLDQLNRPHGLALRQGWLYIAEQDGIGRIRFDEQVGSLQGEYQKVIEGLPDSGNHWSKTIGFGSDGWLYISIGSTCNVCEEKDKRRATMMRFKPDGSQGEIYATGLRNSVGFDWAPWDGALYATDNGRDLLGDDYPPCELNKIEEGKFYGWPYINGFGDLDPDKGQGKAALLATSVSPAFGFRAHNAPLGMRFNRSDALPQQFIKSAFVALHGSWNRSTPDGYKVVSLHWNGRGEISEQDFLTGFEEEGDVIGRPADIVQDNAGVLYVSDDYSGTIYRIHHSEK